MSSTTKQYTPTTTARPTWRDREAQKQRQERESALKAAEEEKTKKFAKTEENFPTLVKPSDRMTVPDTPSGKFADLANKWQADIDAKRIQKKDENTYDNVIALRNANTRARIIEEEEEDHDYQERFEEEETEVVTPKENLSVLYPPHGKRGTYSPMDHEGWRTVTKRKKKQPRVLTEADLIRKYREEFFGEEGEEEAAPDMNGDLTERNQRREFY